MPTIQIPIGGQMVAVDVGDLASESTLQGIQNYSRQNTEILNTIARAVERTGTNTQQLEDVMRSSSNNQSQQAGAVAKLSSQTIKDQQAASKSSITRQENAAKSLFANLESMTAAKLAQTLGSLIPGAIGAAIGGALGTTVGLLEKFGAALNTSRRVGVGFGDSLMDLRAASGNAGMQFDGFTAMLVQNGKTIKSLGDSTSAGAMAFAQLSLKTQEVFREFGNFGMGMTEINQMILMEVEARRTSVGVTLRGDAAYRRLAESVADNVRQQEAMASVTGQDVRERLAAQQSGLSESNVRAKLAGASEDMYRNFNSVSGALSRFDPSGDITNAFGQAIATGFDPMAFAPEMLSLLGPGVTGLLDEAKNNMKTMDPGAFAQWFETSMQDQFSTIKADDARMNQLILLTQSSNAAVANSAKAILDSVNTQVQFTDENYIKALEKAGISDSNEASMLSSTLDRMTAQISSTLSTGAMASLKGIMETLELSPGEGSGSVNNLIETVTAGFRNAQYKTDANGNATEEMNNYLGIIAQMTGLNTHEIETQANIDRNTKKTADATSDLSTKLSTLAPEIAAALAGLLGSLGPQGPQSVSTTNSHSYIKPGDRAPGEPTQV